MLEMLIRVGQTVLIDVVGIMLSFTTNSKTSHLGHQKIVFAVQYMVHEALNAEDQCECSYICVKEKYYYTKGIMISRA